MLCIVTFSTCSCALIVLSAPGGILQQHNKNHPCIQRRMLGPDLMGYKEVLMLRSLANSAPRSQDSLWAFAYTAVHFFRQLARTVRAERSVFKSNR